jgi:hypothetical protein
MTTGASHQIFYIDESFNTGESYRVIREGSCPKDCVHTLVVEQNDPEDVSYHVVHPPECLSTVTEYYTPEMRTGHPRNSHGLCVECLEFDGTCEHGPLTIIPEKVTRTDDFHNCIVTYEDEEGGTLRDWIVDDQLHVGEHRFYVASYSVGGYEYPAEWETEIVPVD